MLICNILIWVVHNEIESWKVNSLRPRRNRLNFTDDLFNAFSWLKMYKFRSEFIWTLFLRFQLIIKQHWFRWGLSGDQTTSHYLNQKWPSLLTHICVLRHQWFNTSGIYLRSLGTPGVIDSYYSMSSKRLPNGGNFPSDCITGVINGQDNSVQYIILLAWCRYNRSNSQPVL